MTIEQLSAAVGIEIRKVVKGGGDKPTYQFFTNRGVVGVVGMERPSSQKRFRLAVATVAGLRLPIRLSHEWRRILEGIESVAVNVWGERSADDALKFVKVVAAYLSAFPPVPMISLAPGSDLPFFRRGTTYFSFGHFRAFVADRRGSPQGKKTLGAELRTLGMDPIKLSGYPTRAWAVPPVLNSLIKETQ
jgi:hypothetical protein